MKSRDSTICNSRSGIFLLLSLTVIGTLLAITQKSYAVATEFYVSTVGRPGASGTKLDPFESLDAARRFVRTVNTNDIITVYLAGGQYPVKETIIFGPEDSAGKSRRITYRAVPGEKPILNGLIRITGWQLHDASKNIWKAPVKSGWSFRELYVDGRKAMMARTKDRLGLVVSPEGFSSRNPFLLCLAGSHSIDGLEIVTRPKPWIQDVLPVSAITHDGVISLRGACWDIVKSRPYPSRNNPVWLQNAYEFLNDPGDWYLDRAGGMVFYIPRSGQSPESMIAQAPGLGRLVEIRGSTNLPVSDLAFEGLTFTGATCSLDPNLGLPQIQSNQPDDLKVDPKSGETWYMNGAVEISHARNLDVIRCSFRDIGGNGLQILKGSKNIVVDRCNFADLGGTAVQVGVGDKRTSSIGSESPDFISDIIVADCIVERTGSDYPSGCGMFIGYAAQCLIYHNILHDLPYTGISLGWGWGITADGNRWNLIEGNQIYRHMRVLVDGGGIYCNGRQNYATLARNYIHDQSNLYGSLYLDDGSSNWSVFENVATKDRAQEWLLYKGSGNHCFGNWSDHPKVYCLTTGPIASFCTGNTVCTNKTWPDEARNVMNESGPLPGIKFTSDPSSVIFDWKASSSQKESSDGWKSPLQFIRTPDRAASKGTECVILTKSSLLERSVQLKQGHRYLLDCGVASGEETTPFIMRTEVISPDGKSIPLNDATTASISGLLSRHTKIINIDQNGSYTFRFFPSPESRSSHGALAFVTLRDVTPVNP